jgi:hypothetical protein
MTAKVGRQAPMNRGATILFALPRLISGRIPDQPGVGSHGLATKCFSDDAPVNTGSSLPQTGSGGVSSAL